PVPSRQSPVASPQSPVPSRQSPVASPQSPVPRNSTIMSVVKIPHSPPSSFGFNTLIDGELQTNLLPHSQKDLSYEHSVRSWQCKV
ncbi:hypothetical protein SD81_022125, partial [Tolypothrix campylonemoides VB511288]